MDNEQIILNLYKQQQYNETRTLFRKVFMAVSTVGSMIAFVVSLFYFENWWYTTAFASTSGCAIIMAALAKLKKIKLKTACFITTLYSAFIFIPAFWLLTSITGAAPYVALIILVAMTTLYTGKTLRILLFGYYIALSLLTTHSVVYFVSTSAEAFINLVYIVMGFWIAVVSIVLYLLYKQREFEELNDKFLRNSFRDELTQLYNRKLLDLILEYQESLFLQQQTDYILVMFDVDNFKEMNDEHGHVFGDIILRAVAECIQDTTRGSDFVVRYGGDEFLVIQSNATQATIKTFIGRIEEVMKTSCQLDIHIEASYGFAARSECQTPEEVLKLADERLLQLKAEKKAGR